MRIQEIQKIINEKQSYYQLKRKSKKFLWNYGIKRKAIDAYSISLGFWYFTKSNILEILSVSHTDRKGRKPNNAK